MNSERNLITGSLVVKNIWDVLYISCCNNTNVVVLTYIRMHIRQDNAQTIRGVTNTLYEAAS
jgi:hypothetical protein